MKNGAYHKVKEILFILRKNYKQVTEKEWDYLYQHRIINGCGGKGSSFRPPMYLFFHADCNIHDFTYTQAYYLFKDRSALAKLFLRIIHRWRCDYGFYKVMLQDIWSIRWKRGQISAYEAVRGSVIASTYFIGVRLAGWRFYGKPIDYRT